MPTVRISNNAILSIVDSDDDILGNVSVGLENDEEVNITSTIVGTYNSNFLSGTDGDDPIFGRGRNDNISAGLGNDLI